LLLMMGTYLPETRREKQ